MHVCGVPQGAEEVEAVGEGGEGHRYDCANLKLFRSRAPLIYGTKFYALIIQTRWKSLAATGIQTPLGVQRNQGAFFAVFPPCLLLTWTPFSLNSPGNKSRSAAASQLFPLYSVRQKK